MRLGVDAVLGSNGGLGDTGPTDCNAQGSYIVMKDDSIHNLYVPSGAQSGLKLVGGFTVPAGVCAICLRLRRWCYTEPNRLGCSKRSGWCARSNRNCSGE